MVGGITGSDWIDRIAVASNSSAVDQFRQHLQTELAQSPAAGAASTTSVSPVNPGFVQGESPIDSLRRLGEGLYNTEKSLFAEFDRVKSMSAAADGGGPATSRGITDVTVVGSEIQSYSAPQAGTGTNALTMNRRPEPGSNEISLEPSSNPAVASVDRMIAFVQQATEQEVRINKAYGNLSVLYSTAQAGLSVGKSLITGLIRAQ